MSNFWYEIDSPIFALAPMEDVTDTVFRELVSRTSGNNRLHVVFSEFMSVDGFLHERGHDQVKHRLFISEGEKRTLKDKGIKIVAQIWGSDPEKYLETARQVSDGYEFDGIDINMGCPVKKIVKHNACSALIKVPELAKEIVLATKEGSTLPVSVKTRIGFNEVATESWITSLLETHPSAITIHGRTQKMQSEGMADWNEVAKAVHLRNAISPSTKILGNGDVTSYEDGLERTRQYNVDGIMVGRGIFSNPFFFAKKTDSEPHERLELLRNHLTRFDQVWQGNKNFAILKRFVKIYVHSFEGAGELRARLMDTHSCEEALKQLDRSGQLHSE
jgi:tRNA-dihydrouridine synthase